MLLTVWVPMANQFFLHNFFWQKYRLQMFVSFVCIWFFSIKNVYWGGEVDYNLLLLKSFLQWLTVYFIYNSMLTWCKRVQFLGILWKQYLSRLLWQLIAIISALLYVAMNLQDLSPSTSVEEFYKSVHLKLILSSDFQFRK